MLAIRSAGFLASALVLALATSAAPLASAQDQEPPPVHGVVGAVELDAPTSLGSFAVADGTYQHRAIPVTGQDIVVDDPRLQGRMDATLNYDVLRSGQEPVPAWGTLTIGDGAWVGTFTGMRKHDFEPFQVDAFLVGTGEYEGLCAVLDINATAEAWSIDGVIHPLPMGV